MRTVVSIKDIADRLKLSRNTVAKALNGQHVSEKTRARVLSAARAMDYKSINSAANSYLNRGKKILLLLGAPHGPLSPLSPIIMSIHKYCFDDQPALKYFMYNPNERDFDRINRKIERENPDGIIVLNSFDMAFNKKLIDLGLPLCFFDFAADYNNESGNFDIIKLDDFRSIFTKTCKLHKDYEDGKKHNITKFCFVGDINHSMSFRERYFGMLQALAANNIEHERCDDIIHSEQSFDYDSPTAIGNEISKLRAFPNCFICANDFIAVTVCKALERKYIIVDKRCLVVGFDHMKEVSGRYPIISFKYDRDALSAEAIFTLLERINRPQQTNTRIITIHTESVG